MGNPFAASGTRRNLTADDNSSGRADSLILLAFGVAIFLGTLFSPPFLMDDVDAVNAQIARNMLDSGDWVTARINGVLYLEKSPLHYWLMALSYRVFGVHDWAARLPGALGAIGLMLMTAALARWGFGRRAGFYAGLAVGTSVGLFLFTRTVIPDILLVLAITCAFYCFLRAVEDEDRQWAFAFWAAIGVGLLLKGLLAAVVPVATATLYLLIRRRLFRRRTWQLLRPFTGILLALALYSPWVILASLRNPPVFDFTFHSDPGVYRGFFWFYFLNEHVLRFLNLRYPRDYNTVPRLPFFLLHLVWIFPWSAFLPAALKPGRWQNQARASQLRLLAFLWIVFLLAFLSFSTTQEYYSMPCYPAFAVLVGGALARGSERWINFGYHLLLALGITATATACLILYCVRNVVAVGDISSALTHNPDAYTLSLGHLHDLTLKSFAYLRGPLVLAAIALGAGSILAWRARGRWVATLYLAATMAVLAHAAKWAMAVFDPYLSSHPLADVIARGPAGQLIIEGHYYPASSVAFYSNQPALLLNGRVDNMVYGAAAPGAPPVFIEDTDLAKLWGESQRLYLVAPVGSRSRLEALLQKVYVFGERGGKCVLSNQPE